MRAGVLLLVVLCALASMVADAAPVLHARATLEGPRAEPGDAELRWLWERRQLRLGVLGLDNPPFDLLGTGQAYEGITADYAGLLAEQLNLQVSLRVFTTFDEAATALRDGAIDLLGSVSEPQAMAANLRLSRPYAEDRPLLIAQQDDLRARIRRAQTFDLVMVEGYRTLEQVKERYPLARVHLHPTPYSALTALALGQADLYLGNALGARYVLGRSQLGGIEEIGHAALPRQGIGFAMLDSDSPLPRLVDTALAALSERQHARIRERWSPVAANAHKPAILPLSEREQRWLRDNPSVRVLADEHLLPLSYRDGKARWRGLSLDILEMISRRTGLRFEVEVGGRIEQMVEQVRTGKAQLIAGLPSSPAMARYLDFSRSYLSASRVLVTEDVDEAPTRLAQLAGQPLALVWGSAVQETLAQDHPQVLPLVVAGPSQALQAVAQGRAAAAVLTLDDARPLIARGYQGRLKISDSLPMPPAHFALASARGAVELQGILNKALLSLDPRQTALLVRRWRNPMIVADGLWPRYRSRILFGFGIALVALLLASLWIRYLRRLQVQLRRATLEADAANRAKTRFLTTMSHEIRTPLHALLGMLDLARHKAEQGVVDHLAVEVASEAARGLLELIGDILDVSRIESGHLQLAPQRVRLREQVERVTRLFEQQARDKGLELRLEARGAVDAEVMLDPLRFKQVLANVLSNAIKFTRSGWVDVRLLAVPRDDRLSVVLQVRDTGVGIAAEELASLGQPFRQASNQCQSPRSSAGLGLGISRSLCEMMGGHLHLRSSLGQGTQVDIRLNLPRQVGTRSPAPVVKTFEPGRGTCLRVLVVDDHPANRLLLAQQLDYLGHQARVAEDGAQALRLWLKERFDVVISDCNMPGLNGHALARAIREHERRNRRPACRVIGLTANAQVQERRRCRAAGMDTCLFKPLGLDSLAQALERCLPSVATPSEGDGLLDIEHLRRLVGEDDAAFEALLGDLRASNREDLRRLRDVGDDPRELAQIAHRVKGGARIARVQQLMALCERLERSCATEPLPLQRLRADKRALGAAMQRLERQLDQQAARGVPG